MNAACCVRDAVVGRLERVLRKQPTFAQSEPLADEEGGVGPQSELRAIKPVASFTLIDSQFEEHAAKERVFLASSWGKKEAAWIEGWRRHTAGQILALNGSDGGAEARLRARGLLLATEPRPRSLPDERDELRV